MIYLKVVETILAITIYCTYVSQVNTPEKINIRTVRCFIITTIAYLQVIQ